MNVSFVSDHAFFNMYTEDLQKIGPDLVQKYSLYKNLLVIGINKNISALELLQHKNKYDLEDAFPNISIALLIYCT